jgi:hypothetical protein
MGRRTGCKGCRERHLKCDHGVPKCSNCVKAKSGRTCVYGELKLRYSKFSFKDEARETGPLKSPTAQRPPLSRTKTVESTTETSKAPQTPRDDYYHSPESFRDAESPARRARLFSQESRRNDPPLATSSLLPARRNPIFQATEITEVESSIFQFYKDHAGPWLDIVTPHRHMSQTVPRLAITSPVLRHACLAYAANCMWLRKTLTTTVKDYYHDQVISRLINALATHPSPATDETLLATAVILRMSEQFYEISEDKKHHLRGASSLFSSRPEKWSSYQTDLSGTSFWIYVRESLRLAYMNGEKCQFDLGLIEHEISYAPAADEVWTNRSSYLLAYACNLHFGSQELDAGDLESLLAMWAERVPSSFRPWYVQTASSPFSHIAFLSCWHGVAWQQYLAAKVLLAVHLLQSRGVTNILEVTRYTEAEIREPTRMLAGICFADNNMGSRINGSHLLSWCAQYLIQPAERKAVLDWLEETMADSKWANKTCIRRLKQIWDGTRAGWSDEETVISAK